MCLSEHRNSIWITSGAYASVFAKQSHSQCALSDVGAMHMHVLVRDNNVDEVLRVLKKKMQREGVFREMKRRSFYEKPSVKATREKAATASRPQTCS
jgi:ribosomal protein S21